MFSLEYPYALLLLILFIACSYFCKKEKSYMYMPVFKAMNSSLKANYLSSFLKWLGIIAAILAVSSPISKNSIPSTKPAHAVMLLMDVSDSMSQGRMAVNSIGAYSDKLSVAKTMASDYIRQRKNDHVGIIVFGDFAYVASPLSFDHNSVASILDTLQRGVAGSKTAMYDALFLSARLLKDSKAKEKAVILLTDGFNTAGSIPYNAALRAIQSENLKVFTIGIGRYGDYDKKTLVNIANRSGGKFFAANDAQSLKKVYKQIDKLQKSKLKDKVRYKKNYLFMYPLMLSILSLFILLFLHVRGKRL
jgi:Ca-activated chloride channel family protein